MDLGVVGRAVGMFAVTNIDDILILALFFGQAAAGRARTVRIVAGQYVGFAAILLASVLGALGAGLLPESAVPYLGLLPLALGLNAARVVWTDRSTAEEIEAADHHDQRHGPGVAQVAAVTLANGGDNVGVYVPVFAAAGTGALSTYVIVFLIGVAVWCALGRFLATRAPIAKALARYGHIAFPVVLISIGAVILIEGGAFGL